jgi:cystathionine gamma-lyase
MQRHNQNAIEIAGFLEHHPKIKKVIYPGLKSHPQHQLAKQQATGFGGVISVEIKGKTKDAKAFLERLTLFAIAESLGGVESLIELPVEMTHASVSREICEKTGITDTLVRISIGVEDVKDLINDLKQALG